MSNLPHYGGMPMDDVIEEIKRKCTILCLDVPFGTEFGIDYHSWNCGQHFKGVKLISPGVHFVYYNATSKYGGSAPKTSFFIYLNEGEVLVKRWNPETEDLDDLDKDSAERFRGGVERFEFDKELGAYPQDMEEKWNQLSCYITKTVLEHLEPVGKKISSIRESESETNTHSNQPYFSKIPTKKSPKGASPAEVTKYHFDKSALLYELLGRYKNDQYGILGELQFAFITFLMGQEYEGFEHWKNLVGLFCGCEEALTSYPDLFIKFIRVFQYQLREVPSDFFDDIISGQNFLTVVLRNFFELLSDNQLSNALKEEATSLQKYVEKRFGRNFSINWEQPPENDEDAPVVVLLDEHK